MSGLDAFEAVLGGALVLVTLYDVFQSVVIPRPAVGRLRLSVTFVRLAWRAWRGVAERPRKLQTRESALAAFAPMMVVTLLILWAFFLILGFALMYSGLHQGLHPAPGSFGATLYFSAGRLLAFSAVGVEVTGAAIPILTSIEAASGFGLFALVISLLFSLFNAFARRETAVVALDALAGAPSSGIQLLETCATYRMPAQLGATFDEWRMWTVDVLESHLSYPLLLYFRSSHDNEAWINSFGAVMDAATLVLSTVDDDAEGKARLMYKVGTHFVADMRHYLRYDRHEREPLAVVEREEFAAAWTRLKVAGYQLRDQEAAWEEFTSLRNAYGGWVNLLARGLAVPPAPWIGDRSYLPHRDRASSRGRAR